MNHMKKLLLLSSLLLLLATAGQAQTVPSYVPSNGLVGWWPFNANATDESGNGNNGTVNGATLTVDRFGNPNQAYVFDGVNDYINCGNILAINNQSQVSFSAWIKYNSIINSSRIIGQEQSNNSTNGLALGLNNFAGVNNSLKGVVRNGSSSLGYTGAVLQPLNYYHVAMVFNGNEPVNADRLKLYINGVIQNITIQNLLPTTTPSNIFETWIGGTAPVSNDAPFHGELDDIGIWNRALTQQEITNLYTASTPTTTPCSPLASNLMTGLVGYWPFCGNANDESGNGNNGVNNGAVLTTDRFGNSNEAYSFDGVSSYINLGHNASLLRSNASFSFSYWTNLNSYNPSFASTIISNRSGSIGSIIQITGVSAVQGTGKPAITAGASNFVVNQQSISASNWTHIIHTYDYNSLQFKTYIDGVLSNSATLNHFTENAIQDHTIGREPLLSPPGGGNAYALDGKLDDIALWNRVLTQNEITQLYTGSPCITYQTITVTDTLIINANLTGINPVTFQNSILVYPNPARDHITIDFGANYSTMNGYSLSIGNSLSQTVYTTPIAQQSVYIDLNTWTGNGVYFVYLYDSTGNLIDVRKIVIQ